MIVREENGSYVCSPEQGNGHDIVVEREFLRHMTGLDKPQNIRFNKKHWYNNLKFW